MESILANLNSEIIVADLKDENQLMDLITVLSEYRIDVMGTCVPYNVKEIDQLKKKLLEQKSIIVFLVYEEGNIAGGSVCFESMSTFSTKGLLNIHDICVLKQYRKRGLGRKIMNHIISYAESLDCSKITLEVREGNSAARKLYSSLEFSETSPRMDFWYKSLTTGCSSK